MRLCTFAFVGDVSIGVDGCTVAVDERFGAGWFGAGPVHGGSELGFYYVGHSQFQL